MKRLLESFYGEETNPEKRRRIALLVGISVVGSLFLIVFSITAILQGHLALAIFDIATAILVITNLVDARKRQNFDVNIRIGIAFVSILYVYLYISGGILGTAFVWYFTYPLITCYLLGSRSGGIAAGLLMLPVLILLLTNPEHPSVAQYSLSFVLRFSAAYIVVGTLSYLFERTREQTREELDAITQSLENNIERRTREILAVNIRLKDDLYRQRNIERALKEKEQKYRTIIENISDLICVHDLDGRIAETNLPYKVNFGYSHADLIGKNIGDLIERECRGGYNGYLKRVKAAGNDEGTFSIRTKNNQRLILEYSSILVLGPKGEYEIHGFAKDITDRWNAERALENSEKRYRTLFEKAGDAIFLFDATQENMGKIIEANMAAAAMHGYSRDEIKDLNVKDLDSSEDALKMPDRVQRILNGEWINTEVKHIRKDGSMFPVEISAGLLELDKNKYILAFDRDISERSAMEQKLRRSEKMEALGTLAGGIAHDFNNLLMGIQGRSSLMTVELEPSHPHQEHFKAIEEYIQSATNLTRQLLGLARGGKYEVKPFDLNTLLRSTANMFGRTRKEIHIQTDTHHASLVIEADRGQIEQVLLNLFLNALQAMPQGGNLYLETRLVTLNDSDCQPYQIKAGRYAKVTVQDTGIGMDETTRQRIFDPFFTTKEKGRGTGLGLASADGIVKNHAGIITLSSTLGQGTRFDIHLPISEKAPQEEKAAPKKMVSGSETILLIDDEDMILNVGQAMLEKLGYRVIVARGGEVGLEEMTQHVNEIDLVIIDLIMPGMNGSVTFDRIREIQPAVTVVLSSGYAVDGEASEVLSRGCNGFIQKPFSLSELSNKIRTVIDDAKETLPT